MLLLRRVGKIGIFSFIITLGRFQLQLIWLFCCGGGLGAHEHEITVGHRRFIICICRRGCLLVQVRQSRLFACLLGLGGVGQLKDRLVLWDVLLSRLLWLSRLNVRRYRTLSLHRITAHGPVLNRWRSHLVDLRVLRRSHLPFLILRLCLQVHMHLSVSMVIARSAICIKDASPIFPRSAVICNRLDITVLPDLDQRLITILIETAKRLRQSSMFCGIQSHGWAWNFLWASRQDLFSLIG